MTEQLTAAQRKAVEHFEGPLLVLAGPGSGKTRVITHRIARLLERGVRPDEILALTFTNKAAREMADRACRLLRGTRVQVSTFHRFCARLLRSWPEAVGLKANFTILDQSDQTQLVRRIMKDAGHDTSHHDPRRVLSRISNCRNDLITADQFRRRYEEHIGGPLDAVVYNVFAEYEQRLLHQNAVDFDDLLLHVVSLLEHDAGVREFLDQQFRFVLVDEYQDTNLAQYRIVSAISQQFPNLCATGDPDQSIYGWRGARPGNIAEFERDFPAVAIVSLEQNFRSTGAIVHCADELINHNPRRHRGAFITQNEHGAPVQLKMFPDGEAEANSIADEIAQQVRQAKRSYSDFAVFYRVNALSRSLETAFSRHGVPFQVAAGYSFYERTEVRDLVGYLRLIENPADSSALERIINRPARGIGEKTLQRIRSFADSHGISVFESAGRCEEIPSLTNRARKALEAFVDMITRLNERSADNQVVNLIEQLIAEINYLALWRDEFDEVDQDRAANVYELINAARLYEDQRAQDAQDPPSLQGFLELASLTSEADSVDESKGAVTLMTLHAAKGLEFRVVYIIGVENGLIPHERAVRDGDPASFQEERRLLFVGVTRAMQQLYLTQTRERNFRGARQSTISSPFAGEMTLEVVSDDDLSFLTPPTLQHLDEHMVKARERYQNAQRTPRPGLMTAADLERKLASIADADTGGFSIGMSVRHPRYGRGIVVESSGGSRRGTLTVEFEHDNRRETFVATRCPLQPIGNARSTDG